MGQLSPELEVFGDLAYEELVQRHASLLIHQDYLQLIVTIRALARGGVIDERINTKTARELAVRLVERYDSEYPADRQPPWRALAKASGLR